jgi:hypothetical protein
VFFVGLLFVITAAISGSAAFFSITGLALTFSASFKSVIVMGVALEAGKLVTASVLYKYWDKLTLLLKSYMIIAVAGLMFITSMGVFSFLSAAHQTDTIDLKTGTQRIEYLHSQQADLHKRLTNIDDQIAHVPDDQVRKKLQLMKGLKDEKAKIITDLDAVNTEEQQLSAKKLQDEAKVGPVVFLAQALGKSVDQVTSYLIGLIMGVFDPLAVALTLALNVVLKDRAQKKEPEPRSQSRSEIIRSIREFDN